MRTPKTISEEINDLDSLIGDLDEARRQYPDDPSISFSIRQADERKARLNIELEKSYAYHRLHLFDIAIQTEERIRVALVSKIFNAYETAMASIGQIVNIKSVPELYFSNLFRSSFGIRTYTKLDSQLLLSDYTIAFSTFFDLNNKIEDSNTALALFKNNRTAMRKFAKYYKEISEAGFPIRVRWGAPDSSGQTYTITPDEAIRKRTLLLKADTIETEIIELSGVMKELNLLSNSFIVVYKNQTSKIKFSPEFVTIAIEKMGKSVSVKYRHERFYNFEEEKLEEARILIAIS